MSNLEADNNSTQGIVVELPLKFNFQTCSDITLDLSAQNRLAFDIADTFAHVDTSVDKRPERGIHDKHLAQNKLLEKKLNLVMQLLNTLLINLSGQVMTHSLKLSANSIQWDNSQDFNSAPVSIKKDQNLIFDFYPASELPYPIKLCGVVVDVNGSTISANFYPLDSRNQERFEKWVFQLHRRSLQKKPS